MPSFDEITDKLPILTGGFLAIGILLFLLATIQFRRSRSASFWLQRRRAGQRGLRVSLLALVFLAVGSVLCVMTLVLQTVEDDETTPVPELNENGGGITSSPETLPVTVFPTDTPMPPETLTLAPSETSTDLPAVETATLSPTETETVSPSATDNVEESASTEETAIADLPSETPEADTPTSMPTETLTPEPTETETEIPTETLTTTPTSTNTATSTTTPTASPTLTLTIPPTETPITPTSTPTLTPFPTALSQITPAVARANPADEANLAITGIATSVDIDLNPLEIRDSFRTGFRRLYFFIEFEGMNTGVLWRWALYRDGEFLDGQPLLWGVPSEGETFFFVGDNMGFVPGTYEMRLYLGDEADSINSVEFTVTN